MKKKNSCSQSGAYILLDSLVQNNVEHIFGYPGGAILPIYDELFFWEKRNLLKHILVRHEQSAVHAADAYSRYSNKVGVCFATSGPGATNLVTGIATAKMDSVPIVIITGQVAQTFLGTDAFQEIDIFSITNPIVKHAYIVRDIKELPKIVNEAFYLAQNGRPGPVLIDVPKDIGLEGFKTYTYKGSFQKRIPGIHENLRQKKVFSKLLNHLNSSFQPLFYLGGGVLRSNAYNSLNQLAEMTQIPVTTTLMGKSSFNEKNHLALGMLGMHGTAYANFAISECDFLIALGARFDDRVTGKLEEFACEAEVFHMDIDANEISKNRSPQTSLLGDIKKALNAFLIYLRKKELKTAFHTQNWLKRISRWKKMYPIDVPIVRDPNSSKYAAISAKEAIQLIFRNYPEAAYTTDVGQHQMWSAQILNLHPKKWISSAGLGTMGFGLPAAIGAKLAHPKQEVVCISGDSSFQMSLQELGTIAQYDLRIHIFIINNGWQGMVRQWQEAFYGSRFANSFMENGMPDFALLAESYGIHGVEAEHIFVFSMALLDSHFGKKADLCNVLVLRDENCFPMVTPGRSNSQMLGI